MRGFVLRSTGMRYQKGVAATRQFLLVTCSVLGALTGCMYVFPTQGVAQISLSRPLRPTELPVLLRQRVQVAFQPVQAFFLIELPDDSVQRVAAVSLAPFQSVPGGEQGSWQVGAWFNPALGVEKIRVALLVIGTEGQYFTVPFRELEVSTIRAQADSLDAVRAELLKRKEVLRSWTLQTSEQQRMLQRLRADAEIIGGFGRIIDAKEERQRLEVEVSSIDGHIRDLDRLVELARALPAPKNLSRREHQLSSQVTLLAAAARDVESGEAQRRGNADRSLQEKLRLIEETRYDDLDQLRREAAALQAELTARGG